MLGWGMSVNPITWQAQVGGVSVLDQSGLHSEFQASLEYVVRPYFETNELERFVNFELFLFLYLYPCLR